MGINGQLQETCNCIGKCHGGIIICHSTIGLNLFCQDTERPPVPKLVQFVELFVTESLALYIDI